MLGDTEEKWRAHSKYVVVNAFCPGWSELVATGPLERSCRREGVYGAGSRGTKTKVNFLSDFISAYLALPVLSSYFDRKNGDFEED